MAKDPAMLWYWADWYSGTTTLSRFLKGCYMDLLHAQFNNGNLSLEEIKTVLGSDFGQAWPTLQKKFAVDAAGKYFNVRLDEEKTKRANYTASRRKNLESSHMEPHMSEHMPKHMENVNRNVIGIKTKKESEIFETKEIAFNEIRDNYEIIAECIKTLSGRGWHVAKEIDLIGILKMFLNGKADLSTPKNNVKKHFKNWLIREKLENLQTYAEVFKSSQNGRT